jgi:hypothetical protein
VLPDAPLPLLSSEIESAVKACLDQSTVAVHLLGRHYGTTPEDAAESVPALQVRWSAEQARQRSLPRLIWLPGEGETTDERQRTLLADVQNNPQWHFSADLFEGNLTLLKKDLLQKLSPAEKKPAAPVTPTTAGPARVYVMGESADEAAIEPLEDFLFEQGLEVCLAAGDGGSADADTLHRENLLSCDGVLVFYGSAPRAWVDIKLRDVLKAPGYGRSAPIAVQGVYIAAARSPEGTLPLAPDARHHGAAGFRRQRRADEIRAGLERSTLMNHILIHHGGRRRAAATSANQNNLNVESAENAEEKTSCSASSALKSVLVQALPLEGVRA